MTHRYWQRELGSDAGVVGKTININSRPCVVLGVLNPAFYGLVPGDSTEIYAAMRHGAQLRGAPGGDKWLFDARFWGVALIARRAEDVTLADLQPVWQPAFAGSWSGKPKTAAAAPRVHLEEGSRGLGFLRREFRNPLLVLGTLVTLLLVIACTNIANLLLARAAARQKEVAMRVSLGCSQARLMRQFLTESVLLAALGGVASVAIAYATANVLGGFLQGRDKIPVTVALDLRLLATVLFITVTALLLFGVFPAWRGSRLSDAAWLNRARAAWRTCRGASGTRGGFSCRRRWQCRWCLC